MLPILLSHMTFSPECYSVFSMISLLYLEQTVLRCIEQNLIFTPSLLLNSKADAINHINQNNMIILPTHGLNVQWVVLVQNMKD